jgi:N-acetylmuramoyl-L-alanine amidase
VQNLHIGKMKIAVCIGHNPNDKGAFSRYLQKSEYDYNSEVVQNLHGFDVYRRQPLGSYRKEITFLAQQVNKKNYDLVIELHFNAFNGAANGVETIGYPGSKAGKLGQMYCDLISKEYSTLNRGHKEATSDARGLYFLQTMKAPSLILEPFFGDHIEAEKFKDTKKYASVLCNWFNQMYKL